MAVTVSTFAGLTALELQTLDRSNPQFVPINTTGTGDKTLVAGVAGKRICVMGMTVSPSATTGMSLYSGASADGDVIVDDAGLITNFSASIGYQELPAFWCETGESLVSVVNSSSNLRGHLVYMLCEGA